MKKKLLIKCILGAVLFFKTLHITAQTPDYDWASYAGGDQGDQGTSVTTDANGSVIVVGDFFSPSISFGSTVLNNTGVSSMDVFVVKYDSDGGVIWSKNFGGSENEQSFSITTDVSGNIILAGYFSSPTISFDAIVLNNADATGNTWDLFVVKLDTNGNVLWANRAGGTASDGANVKISTDLNSNIIVSGNYSSPSIVFGSTTLVHSGGSDIFITKYNELGDVIWANGLGSSSQESNGSIATDSEGNILITGTFYGTTLTFGSITINKTGGLNGSDVFIAKYDSTGVALWANGVGGGFGTLEEGVTITCDNDDNVLVGGIFRGSSIVFGTTTLTNSGTNSYDLFLAKYATDGSLIWAKKAGGSNDEYIYSVKTNSDGDILISGTFQSSSIIFGTTTLNNLGSNADIFLAKYDISGNVLWAKSAGGFFTFDVVYSAIFDNNDDILMVGGYNGGSLTLGSIVLTNAGNYDMFVTKLKEDVTNINTQSKVSNLISLFPNPTTSITTLYLSNEIKNAQLSIVDITGKEVYFMNEIKSDKVKLNLTNLNKSLYLLKVITAEKQEVIKFIKD